MSKIKKLLSSILLCSVLLGTFTTNTLAYNSEQPTIKQNYGATVDFVDESLQTTNAPVTRGAISEVYSHSTYEYLYSSISEYDVGPRHKEDFIISVASGQTVATTNQIEIEANISYNYGVSAELKNIINVGFDATLGGKLAYTWNRGVTYSGVGLPEQYNSVSYYAAINYDLYTTKVKRYDYYKVYNNGIYVRDITYTSNEEIEDVKVPKKVTYSVPSEQ